MFVAVIASLVLNPFTFEAGQSSPLPEVAEQMMKNHMNQFNGTRFSEAVKTGDVSKYEVAIKSVKLGLNPALTPLALYDPETKTINLSKDPRTLTLSNEKASMSETIWHEVTHRLEDVNGDFGKGTTTEYDERNVEYMTFVFSNALRKLVLLEQRARDGANPEVLGKLWDGFVLDMERVKSAPFHKVDERQLQEWFGFSVDVAAIERLYLADDAEPAIREAVGGIPAKAAVPKGGAWVLTKIVSRPTGNGTEADHAAMVRGYAESDARVRGTVRPGSSLFTFSMGERYYALGTEWSRPASVLKPGGVLKVTAKAGDKGCANVGPGDGTFASFALSLWGTDDYKSWRGSAYNLGALYGKPHENTSKQYEITLPAAKVREMHLVIAAGGIHWGREIVYVFEWRDK